MAPLLPEIATYSYRLLAGCLTGVASSSGSLPEVLRGRGLAVVPQRSVAVGTVVALVTGSLW